MNRSVAVYAALLVTALIASYLTWTSDGEATAEGERVVARFDPADIDRITYTSPEVQLDLEVREDDRGRYVWVDERREVSVQPSKGSAEDAGPAEDAKPTGDQRNDAGVERRGDRSDASSSRDGAPDASTRTGDRRDRSASERKETETRSYKASGAAQDLLESLDPLEAVRELDVETADQKNRYGLAETPEEVTIHLKSGASRSFAVGDYNYGRRHIYMLDRQTETGYAVDASVLGPLKYGERRLPEQSLVDANMDDTPKIVVERGNRQLELVHENIDDRSASYWRLAAGPDEETTSAASWVRRLFRLRADSYAADRSTDDLTAAAEVTVHPRQGDSTTVELLEGPPEETSSDEGSASEAQPTWFARSDFTRSLVELAGDRTSTLIQDIDTLRPDDGSTDSPGSPD